MLFFTILISLYPSYADLDLYNSETVVEHVIKDIKIQFPRDYISARKEFHQLCRQLSQGYFNHDLDEFRVPSQFDQDLTVSSCYLQSKKPTNKLLVITSGTHGAEAPAGHAVQTLIMKMIAQKNFLPTNVLFIHSLNPYGFKYFRRPTENNVDLNRNFGDNFKIINTDYKANPKLFHSTGKASYSWSSRLSYYWKAVLAYLFSGKKSVLKAIGGQFHDPKGTNYGGIKPEPQTIWVQSLFKLYGHKAKHLLHIDLHTGLGKKDKLQIIAPDNLSEAEHLWLNTIYPTLPIVTGESDDFYPVYGAFDTWVMQEFKNKKVISVVYEYGTLDSQTILGGLHSLHTFKLENQGFQYGYDSSQAEKLIHSFFIDLFNPQSTHWQKTILKQTSDQIEQLLPRFATED